MCLRWCLCCEEVVVGMNKSHRLQPLSSSFEALRDVVAKFLDSISLRDFPTRLHDLHHALSVHTRGLSTHSHTPYLPTNPTTNPSSMNRGGGGGGRKVLLPPINFIFKLLQQHSTVQIWLYEQLAIRIEGRIRVSGGELHVEGLRLTGASRVSTSS